jgi:Rieske Fe-S protein
MSCDRRTFVARGLGVLATAALPWGCVPAVARVPVRAGAIRVHPDDHPALTAPGGHLRVQPAGRPGPIYVLALDDGFAALSPICTHQGCTVGLQSERLVCPCHGSTYDRRGRVLRGPAPAPLRSFPVEIEPDGTLVVTLGDA